ncbi:MAG: sugar phosphate nucleotidyltransferase [Gammaproteobacteria bacterium]
MSHTDVLCLILGGGRGTRLWPLTKARAKPAVPIGGKYRLVDVALSNSLNSGIDRIAVLTQFNSVSLNRHIAQTYHFDLFHKGWVQVLAAEQRPTVSDWYQGTADAVRKHLAEIQAADAQNVLVLAGDQLYRMDYSEIIEFHRTRAADVSLAVLPVSRSETHRFGILKQATDGRITAFVEKPRDENTLADLASDIGSDRGWLASTGIYLFRTEVLISLLDSNYADFGSHLIPSAIASHRVYGYIFNGYWEDIGTIRAFFEANLALAQPEPLFNFHDPVRPVYTHPRFLPGCRINDVHFNRVLVADGCVVEQAEITNSLLGNRSIIGQEVIMEDTVLMGADYYEGELSARPQGVPAIGIGPGSRIKGAIIDKNARIGTSVRIEPFPVGTDLDHERWAVRDGIVVIAKDAVLPNGTVIAPD